MAPPTQKCIKKSIQLASRIMIDFLMDFGTNLASKTDPRATENPPKIVSIFELIFKSSFNRFCIDFGSQVGSKIHERLAQKSIQEAIDLVIDFGIHLSSIFDGNWVQQRPADTPKSLKNL